MHITCGYRAIRTALVESARVHGDRERLAMVVRNLIDDAFRCSAAGMPLTLTMTAHGNDVEISVSYRPTAAGAPACEARRAFDDLGIGRHVTSDIVEAHGRLLAGRGTGRVGAP